MTAAGGTYIAGVPVQKVCTGSEYEVCMWSSVFTILVAVFDLCALMKHVTMFSEDGFTKIDDSVAGSD